jgi:membrane-bound inhibitor of C-type lysozyme
LAACGGGSGWWPWQSDKGIDVATRVPPGATEFSCAGAKRLLVRFTADGKSAWVIYPDREFRLDRPGSGAGELYTNGVTSLSVQGADAHLDEGSTRAFAECKRKGS